MHKYLEHVPCYKIWLFQPRSLQWKDGKPQSEIPPLCDDHFVLAWWNSLHVWWCPAMFNKLQAKSGKEKMMNTNMYPKCNAKSHIQQHLEYILKKVYHSNTTESQNLGSSDYTLLANFLLRVSEIAWSISKLNFSAGTSTVCRIRVRTNILRKWYATDRAKNESENSTFFANLQRGMMRMTWVIW